MAPRRLSALRPAPPAPRAPGARSRPATRDAVFQAAATAFSARGYAGVGVDDIAARAGVNKAMIYYHFTDKLALYRDVVRDMLRTIGGAVTTIADASLRPDAKLDRFILQFVRLAGERPWFPTLMLREIAEGAPHLDLDTLNLLRTVFLGFGRILTEGQADGVFRPVHPVLAYTSVVGPLIFNAARERLAAQPGRAHLPMLVDIPRAALLEHMQQAARRMLAADPGRPSRSRKR